MWFRRLENGTRELLNLAEDDYETLRQTGTIVIPDDVSKLGVDAFEGCFLLKRIVIPKSVVSISPHTFAGCSELEEITVEEGNPVYDSREGCNAVISTKDNSVVLGCKGTTFPESVTEIGFAAFSNFTMFDYRLVLAGDDPENDGHIKELHVPKTVTRIHANAVSGCGDLRCIDVDPENPNYDSRGNCNAVIESATGTLLIGCRETAIPSDVAAIAPYAFAGATFLSSVSLPEGLQSIGRSAFEFCCHLEELRFPKTLKSIGKNAFWCCQGLKKVVIPASIEEIGEDAFLVCDNATIYCEAPSKSEGWHEKWCEEDANVVWNYRE